VRIDAIRDALMRVMPRPNVLVVSAKTGDGILAWLAWLDERRARRESPG
jgi:hypothetical protein